MKVWITFENVDGFLVNGVRVDLGHLLDVDAALVRGDDYRTLQEKKYFTNPTSDLREAAKHKVRTDVHRNTVPGPDLKARDNICTLRATTDWHLKVTTRSS